MKRPVFVVSGNASIDEYYLVDQIPGPDEAREATEFFSRVGGAATNVAVALARLGAGVRFLGVVGEDSQGKFILDSLAGEGIETKWILKSRKPTGRVLVLLDPSGNRAMVAVRGANLELKPGFVELDPVFEGAGHVHLSSTKPEYSEWVFSTAKKKGLTTSYDPGAAVASKGLPYIRALLPLVDVLLVNSREYSLLGGEELARVFDGILVVKEGAKGSSIPKLGVSVPAFEVKAVDTTGAGDAFNAAFLLCWKLGLDYEACLTAANAAGALKAERMGAQSSPTLDELNRFLSSRGKEPLRMVAHF